MRLELHIQNIHCTGCEGNVERILGLVEGVKVARVGRDRKSVDILYEPPATPLELREQLLKAGYLDEAKPDRSGIPMEPTRSRQP